MATLDRTAIETDYDYTLHLLDGGKVQIAYCPWRKHYIFTRYRRNEPFHCATCSCKSRLNWVVDHYRSWGEVEAALNAINDLLITSDQWVAEYAVPF